MALTANGKHHLLKRDNSTQPIQMQISQKQNTFFHFFFFFAFLKPLLIFKHFFRRNEGESGCISEIKSSEKRR